MTTKIDIMKNGDRDGNSPLCLGTVEVPVDQYVTAMGLIERLWREFQASEPGSDGLYVA